MNRLFFSPAYIISHTILEGQILCYRVCVSFRISGKSPPVLPYLLRSTVQIKKKQQLIQSAIWYSKQLSLKSLFLYAFQEASCIIFQGQPGQQHLRLMLLFVYCFMGWQMAPKLLHFQTYLFKYLHYISIFLQCSYFFLSGGFEDVERWKDSEVPSNFEKKMSHFVFLPTEQRFFFFVIFRNVDLSLANSFN